MKGLSEGVTHYGEEQGYKVIVQDPNLDPQKQVTDLTSVDRVRRRGRRLGDHDRAARRRAPGADGPGQGRAR